MKKFLALVLALVMTMSLVTIGANAKSADYADGKDITNVEAVDVLSEMGILVGYNNQFSPKANITRGAAAKIVAYLALGQAAADALTATGTVFKDVPADNAVAPYIEWAAKNGIVNGYGNGLYGIKNLVTIPAFVKMILGVIGYGQNKEFINAGWQANVISKAVQLGILEGTEGTGYATREGAALYALNALLVPFVTYVPYLNQYVATSVSNNTNNGLSTNALANIAARFNLTRTACRDIYGRPGHNWNIGAAKTLIGTYMDTAVLSYTKGVSVCDILVDLGIAKTSTSSATIAKFFVDGYLSATRNVVYSHVSAPVCENTKVGGQGSLTQVFKHVDANGTVTYDVTVIETYLAKVTNIVKNIHGVDSAITVTVYARDYDSTAVKTTENVVLSGVTGYAKGDYILLNMAIPQSSWTNMEANLATATIGSVAATVGDTAARANVLGLATSMTGAQSIIWSESVASRTVAGTKYALNHQFVRDDTFSSPSTYDFKGSYTWFFDTYGNLIGAVTLDTVYSYGMIKDIQWINPVGSYGYAQATIQYMDGTTASVKVNSIDGSITTYATTAQAVGAVVNGTVAVSTSLGENKPVFFGKHLYKISGDAASVDMVQTAQMTAAAVTTGVSAVTGTATAPATATTIYTNSDTVYMVRTTDVNGEYVYTKYVGFNAVPSYTGAEIDYVLASTGYAQYVYLASATNATTSTGLTYLADLTYSYDNNTRLYTMLNAYVAGMQTSVVVNQETFNKLTAAKNVYYITYANGHGTDAVMVKTDNDGATGNQGLSVGSNLMAIKVQVKDITADALNLSAQAGDITWNITNATLYGAAAKDTTNVEVGSYVVVVYTANTATATAIYAGCVAD